MNQILQIVRIADIVILTPYLLKLSEDPKIDKIDRETLKIIGVGTFVFNLANFIKNLNPSKETII